MPHLSLDNVEPTERVARGYGHGHKPGGQISSRSNCWQNHFLSIKSGNSLRIYKDEDKAQNPMHERLLMQQNFLGYRVLYKKCQQSCNAVFGTTKIRKA